MSKILNLITVSKNKKKNTKYNYNYNIECYEIIKKENNKKLRKRCVQIRVFLFYVYTRSIFAHFKLESEMVTTLQNSTRIIFEPLCAVVVEIKISPNLSYI